MSHVHVSSHERQSSTCSVGHQPKKIVNMSREKVQADELKGEQANTLVWIVNFFEKMRNFSDFHFYKSGFFFIISQVFRYNLSFCSLSFRGGKKLQIFSWMWKKKKQKVISLTKWNLKMRNPSKISIAHRNLWN